MTQNSLEVAVLYYSDEGREASFTDLVNNREVMDLKHYEPSAFWSVSGGFDVTLNGYSSIFHSCNFYCLVKATSFLIHSLYWIKGKQSEWFDTNDDFPNDVLINPTPNTMLRLQRITKSEVVFSYSPLDNNYAHKRGDRYFSDIRLDSDAWFEQTNLALGEYFKILEFVIDKGDKSERIVETMTEYLKVWKDISKH
ncbi:hypothetical protein ACKFKF_32810 [Phormidesmis sp. 146-12]